jgi:ABC-type multidrug transport system fused ATPase/permease subunit
MRHFAAPAVIQLEGVSCGYQPGAPVLRGVTLCCDQGARVALVGPNGQGKSTLVNTLLRELAPLAGTVQAHGWAAQGVPSVASLQAVPVWLLSWPPQGWFPQLPIGLMAAMWPP